MQNQYAPRHAKMRADRSVHGITDSSLKGHAEGSAAPRILVIALAVASLGAGAAVMSGHGSAGQASTRQQAGHASVSVITSPTGATFQPSHPWMF
jgi:hypothetical protein